MNRVTDDVRKRCMALCGAVRDWDAVAVEQALTGADTTAMCVMLAAMIPPGKTGTELLAWADEHPEAAPRPGVDVAAQAAQALVLAAAVRDWDYSRVAQALKGGRRDALAVVAAAMVPDDEPFDQLLAWVEVEYASRYQASLDPRSASANLARLSEAVAA